LSYTPFLIYCNSSEPGFRTAKGHSKSNEPENGRINPPFLDFPQI